MVAVAVGVLRLCLFLVWSFGIPKSDAYKTAFGSPSACLGHGRAAKVRLKLQQLYLAFSAWDLVSCMLVCCLGSYVIFDSDCYIAQHPELTNLPLYAINPNPDVHLIARVRPLNL